MDLFSLQTASLADLWAAYCFVKGEIDVLEQKTDIPCQGCRPPTFEQDKRDLADALLTKECIYVEIARRVDFFRPVVKL